MGIAKNPAEISKAIINSRVKPSSGGQVMSTETFVGCLTGGGQ